MLAGLAACDTALWVEPDPAVIVRYGTPYYYGGSLSYYYYNGMYYYPYNGYYYPYNKPLPPRPGRPQPPFRPDHKPDHGPKPTPGHGGGHQPSGPHTNGHRH